MGRLLDALKRTEVPTAMPERRSPELRALHEMESIEAVVADEEIPFIEVGPRRSMEASPSVLAAHPIDNKREPSPSAPRSVVFRAVASSPERDDRQSRLAAELVAYHQPDSPIGEQYRDLLASLLSVSAGRGSARPQSLLFASARPGSGTTTVLLNLAITAARQGRRRVVVVDANLRRPGVASRLGLPARPGVREVLAGTASFDQALQETEQEGLFALTAGTTDAPSGLRFVSETVRSLLRQLRQRFDLVFVDGADWDGRSELTVLGTACDAVYLVLPGTEAESRAVDDLLRSIPEQGGRLAGCILTGP